MNKTQLLNAMTEESGLTKTDVKKVFEAFQKCLFNELSQGGNLAILGLGEFKVKDRAPRNARNPNTGEMFITEAKKVPVFKPSPILKEAMNGTI